MVSGTGLSIHYWSGALRGEYRDTDKVSQSRAQFPSKEWTRVTFVRKKNGDPFLLIDNALNNQNDHQGASFTLNSAAIITLASTLPSISDSWRAENIQLSDLSLWTDIPSDHDGWARDVLPIKLGRFHLVILAMGVNIAFHPTLQTVDRNLRCLLAR